MVISNNSSLAMNIDFSDKIAVITGAGSGLGRSYALELSKRGAKIVVNDVGNASDGSGDGSIDCADRVVSEIEDNGGRAIANYDSVSSVDGGFNIVQTCIDTFGTIDILINNAGILLDRSFAKMNYDDWKNILDVHLNGAFNVTLPAFKIMKNKKYGRIIMTTSAAALYGNFGQTNYAAAKLAIVGMANTLKLEGKKYNININTVAPISASRLTKDVLPNDIFKKARPEYVAALVLYLCSELCSDSGGLYNVGMGYVNKAAVYTNSWTKILNHDTLCTPEEVQSRWCSISNMVELKKFEDLDAMFLDFLNFFSE